MAYTQAEAEAIAAKREAHKSKHMKLKTWKAVEGEGGYEVKLVDSDIAKAEAKSQRRRDEHELVKVAFAAAMLTGDRDLMKKVAQEGLMAKVRNTLEDMDELMLPGETREDAFKRLYAQGQDAVVQEEINQRKDALEISAGISKKPR